jgi:uncharacterized protein (DUF1330 family)
MTAYMIVKTEIRDAEKIKAYLAQAQPVVNEFGGRYLVRGGAHEVLEGNPDERRTVVISFPSMDAARDFYNDANYQEIKKLRLGIADYDLLLVEGYDGPGS